ncbi:MAG: hypothetical protein Q8R55_02450 [Candidatus Taylorbacteria bacterium]|nr:hypothetical protein [Candidatus Taylorbacteria bacterium]
MSTNNKYLEYFFNNFEKIFKDMEEGVKNNEWHFEYDDTSDILYFLPFNQKVSQDSILVPAGNSEISARIGQKGIETIVVEGFGGFFVPENPEFKLLYEKLTKKANIERDTLRRACVLLLSDFRYSNMSTQLNSAF